MKSRLNPLQLLHHFFASWRFPLCVLVVLGLAEVLQLAMLVLPKAETGLGAFAEQFRVWCYGLDPSTGHLQWSYVAMFLAEPLTLGAIVCFIWFTELARAFRSERRRLLPYLIGAATFSSLTIASLVATGTGVGAAELPFPAASLRRSVPAPPLVLTDQGGQRFDLGSLRGQVVVVTGIYATCFHTCPLIMQQLSRALARLSPSERSDVRVAAVTLNPQHDDQAVMAAAARRYGVGAPEYRLLHGPVVEVNDVLDRLEISRSANPMSGEIDHANLFLLIDKGGKLAYRLTLGAQQEQWLVEALRVLVAEHT
jgi:cytochrome oxidase Cu insertion factor (SCO1/SenC/PrrC family)